MDFTKSSLQQSIRLIVMCIWHIPQAYSTIKCICMIINTRRNATPLLNVFFDTKPVAPLSKSRDRIGRQNMVLFLYRGAGDVLQDSPLCVLTGGSSNLRDDMIFTRRSQTILYIIPGLVGGLHAGRSAIYHVAIIIAVQHT